MLGTRQDTATFTPCMLILSFINMRINKNPPPQEKKRIFKRSRTSHQHPHVYCTWWSPLSEIAFVEKYGSLLAWSHTYKEHTWWSDVKWSDVKERPADKRDYSFLRDKKRHPCEDLGSWFPSCIHGYSTVSLQKKTATVDLCRSCFFFCGRMIFVADSLLNDFAPEQLKPLSAICSMLGAGFWEAFFLLHLHFALFMSSSLHSWTKFGCETCTTAFTRWKSNIDSKTI